MRRRCQPRHQSQRSSQISTLERFHPRSTLFLDLVDLDGHFRGKGVSARAVLRVLFGDASDVE